MPVHCLNGRQLAVMKDAGCLMNTNLAEPAIMRDTPHRLVGRQLVVMKDAGCLKDTSLAETAIRKDASTDGCQFVVMKDATLDIKYANLQSKRTSNP